MSELRERLRSALNEGRWDDYDEIWLDFIEDERGTLAEFLGSAQDALDAGEGTRAGLPVSLLVPQVDQLSARERVQFYEVLVPCLPRDREHRDALIQAYEEEYGDVEGFSVYLKASDLKRTKDPAAAIEQFHGMVLFHPGTFVFHRSGWGIGEIRELVALEGIAIIDFVSKPEHRVRVEAIPEICDHLPDDHLLVLTWKNPGKLREMAKEAPLELLKLALRASDKPMPLPRIREHLVGAVIPSSEWSKWWARQRNALKKDPQIGIGAGKTSTFFLLDSEEAKDTELRRRMEKQSLKGRLRILREAVVETPGSEHDILDPFFTRMTRDIADTAEPFGTRLGALLFLRRHHPDPELPELDEMLAEVSCPVDALNALSRGEDQAELIDIFRQAAGEDWQRLHRELLLGADDSARGLLFNLLKDEGRLGELDSLGLDVNRVPRNAPFFFLWLTKLAARGELELFPSLAGIPPIDFPSRCVGLLNEISLKAEHEHHPSHDLFLKRTRQLLGGKPFTLLEQVARVSGPSESREFYHKVQASRGFTTVVRERILAVMLRHFPDLLSSERRVGAVDESSLYATDEGILKKRRELEELRNEKLPAIYKAIGDAAAMGDLSENYEFTSAIEERENLNRRVMELQAQLDRVQRIDLSQASGEQVSLGSRVTLRELDTGEVTTYSILGPWDGDPEHGVVSYLSPLGQALMDRVAGDEFDVELPSGKSRYRLEGVTVQTEAGAGK